MQAPVPNGTAPVIMDHEERKSQQAIADSTTAAGIPTQRKDVVPDPLHIIEGAGELAYDTERNIKGFLEGSSHIDTTKQHRVSDIIKGRQKIGAKIVSIFSKLWK